MSRELLFSLTKNDFELQFFRAGGKGGQKQNKTSSGCRIIHKESGAVGYCWHDDVLTCRKCGAFFIDDDMENPDYVADPRLVIREMEKRGDWPRFCKKIGYAMGAIYASSQKPDPAPTRFLVYIDLIMDTTGKLATLARDWLREQKGEG